MIIIIIMIMITIIIIIRRMMTMMMVMVIMIITIIITVIMIIYYNRKIHWLTSLFHVDFTRKTDIKRLAKRWCDTDFLVNLRRISEK